MIIPNKTKGFFRYLAFEYGQLKAFVLQKCSLITILPKYFKIDYSQMIHYKENLNLKSYNSFGLEVIAKSFFEFTEKEDLIEFLSKNELPEKRLILGGGSNFLFTSDFNGLILYPNIPGIGFVNEDRNSIYLEAGAGEKWDDLVSFSVKCDLGGLENLSNIPGKVGASSIQNIGAYGKEVKESIYLVKGVELSTGKEVLFSNEDCRFGYRDSIFKNELKGNILVTSVVFKLDKFPEFSLEYGSLKTEVEKLGNINLSTIRQAVINIRGLKLPDPATIGNAGSFFKNPVITQDFADVLRVQYSHLPVYETMLPDMVKLAAGWLIDQCGWKGYREGDAGVHKDQALVLVNYGNATGKEIYLLSENIKASVFEKFGVMLEPEVNIV
jgi:UDP-N-acetylmuramate dehydrogenase